MRLRGTRGGVLLTLDASVKLEDVTATVRVVVVPEQGEEQSGEEAKEQEEAEA